MSHQSELIATDIDAYLAEHERKDLLRFLTCGSVDDGKSTLIGRLLHDSRMIYEDQLSAIQRDSERHGTVSAGPDLALLVDGLKAEREQGITIDVAYRYFSTARRKFIIADTPGHEQYTRNMVTGASTCDLAIILIDAARGVTTQTRRHSFLVSLLGIRHVIVAVNKMDLVEWSQERFEEIRREYEAFAARLEIDDVRFIPISALAGDNVVDRSAHMPWYEGSTLMYLLETVHIASDRNLIDFRFPVQIVLRPDATFRGFSGTVASGVVRPGDEVLVLPARTPTRIRRIVTADGEPDEAFAPMAITLVLADEVDASRGDMICHEANRPTVRDRFDAMIVWMATEPLVPGRSFLIKHTTRSATAQVASIRYRIDVNTLHREPAPTLGLNEIARCELRVNQPLTFDPYGRNRATGAFILIDRLTNGTVGAGMILDRGTDDAGGHWETAPASTALSRLDSRVTAEERALRFGQRPVTILLTGLAGAGKKTIARALERTLFDEGRACAVIDGQSMRVGLSRDLGFSVTDRGENLRRGAEVARFLNDAGLICIAAFVAPRDDARRKAAEVVGGDRFLVVHLDAPLEVCRVRDRSGVYDLAEREGMADVPGFSTAYESPAEPDLTLATDRETPAACVARIMQLLADRGMFD